MLLSDFAQNGTFYAFYTFYAPRVQRQTHVRVHTSRVTNFAFDTYPRKMHFERRTAQKLARTTFRVVPNCARGGGGWIKSSSSLASEASALAFGQPARFARGLDKIVYTACSLYSSKYSVYCILYKSSSALGKRYTLGVRLSGH